MNSMKRRLKRIEENLNSSEAYRSTFEYLDKYFINATDEEREKMKHPIITVKMLEILASGDDDAESTEEDD